MKQSFLSKKTTLWQNFRYGKMLTTQWSPLAKPEHNKKRCCEDITVVSIRPTDLTFITTSLDKDYYGPHLPYLILCYYFHKDPGTNKINDGGMP